jgi:hypothetical protein
MLTLLLGSVIEFAVISDAISTIPMLNLMRFSTKMGIRLKGRGEWVAPEVYAISI